MSSALPIGTPTGSHSENSQCTGNEAGISGRAMPSSADEGSHVCTKCKMFPQAMVASQDEKLCKDCLSNSLISRMKSTINRNKLIEASDKVLLGISGGFCSRSALDFLQQIQTVSNSKPEVMLERGKIPFELAAAFVDECVVTEHSAPIESVREQIKQICDSVRVPLHFVALENVFTQQNNVKAHNSSLFELEEESHMAKSRFRSLLCTIPDSTGREDLVEILRIQSLVKLAERLGFSKVALASSTSRMAVKVIADTCKGRGFSIPSSLSYINNQLPIPVILPLRDCSARHLALHCHFKGHSTVVYPWLDTLNLGTEKMSINLITEAFVKSIQEDNWSRESSIVRTAAKLKTNMDSSYMPSIQRSCLICSCAISSSNAWQLQQLKSLSEDGRKYIESYCASCRFQILNEDPMSGEIKPSVVSLLPMSMKLNPIRDQIQEFLLEDDE